MSKPMLQGWREVGLLEVAPIKARLVDPRKPELNDMILIAPDHIQSGVGRIGEKATAREQGAISGKFYVKKNSVIYSKIRPYLMKAAIADEEVLCSADMYPFECTGDITSTYLLNVLLSKRFTDFAISCSSRTGIPKINREEISGFRFFLPPISDQINISSVAFLWDAAIEKTEQLITAKLRAKDSYAIFLLAAKHPDFKRADELFTPVSEKGRDDLQILSVTQDQGVIPRIMLDKQILMEPSSVSSFKVVREGDFVISLRSFQGGLEYSPYKGVVSPAYTVLRPREDVCPEFFRHYLKSKDFLQRLSVAVIGIRDGKQINFSDFASIKLPVPPRDAQVQYAEFFDAMECEVFLLKRQKDTLQKQKRGLMQKLLTGQWRMAKPVSKEL